MKTAGVAWCNSAGQPHNDVGHGRPHSHIRTVSRVCMHASWLADWCAGMGIGSFGRPTSKPWCGGGSTKSWAQIRQSGAFSPANATWIQHRFDDEKQGLLCDGQVTKGLPGPEPDFPGASAANRPFQRPTANRGSQPLIRLAAWPLNVVSFLLAVPSHLLLHWACGSRMARKGDGRISAADALPHERQTAAVGLTWAWGRIHNDWVRHDADRRR
jgi:hypothetical protein